MKNQEFIQKRLIDECDRLIDAGFYYPAFFLISQGIETLGAFLDKKPFAARAQSKKRFELALHTLFDAKYQLLNQNDWLYRQFRCNFTHFYGPGGFIILSSSKDYKTNSHLENIDGKRLFLIEELYADFKDAAGSVINRLDEGSLANKKMSNLDTEFHESKV